MISIPVTTLPSKGVFYKFNTINIPEMTFKEILQYNSEMQESKSLFSKFIAQLKVLMDFTNGQDVLITDIYPIMFIRLFKSSIKDSSSLIIKFTCPYHNKIEQMNLKLSNIKFNDLDDTILKLQYFKFYDEKHKFRIPTVKQFLDNALFIMSKVKNLKSSYYTKMICYMLSVFESSDISVKREDILAKILKSSIKNDQDLATLIIIYEMISNTFNSIEVECTEGKRRSIKSMLNPLDDGKIDPLEVIKLNTSISNIKTFDFGE